MATLNSTTRKAKRTVAQSVNHLDAARRTAVNGARDVAGDLREIAEDNATEAVNSARRYGRAKGTELSNKAHSAIDNSITSLDGLVRENPLASIGIALAIGFFLGARR
ncbi:glycine zipper domain-containing protein [Aestuariivirga litoralis]|uniref:glycine zipper domain-containing protein n=1 Tax=Aestuariivirga litoralis TaxID=2650924 RepID=UPI0018C7A142|nr:hypothetical protein [Aestuariivirga litoralis]MBG1232414.1 hypothetical protein [Aestuariivirga litoralis]